MSTTFREVETGNTVYAYQAAEPMVIDDSLDVEWYAEEGDWVIEYGKGFIDVVDPESFEKDYEPC